jgi:hypothetical protein
MTAPTSTIVLVFIFSFDFIIGPSCARRPGRSRSSTPKGEY